jgi:hypothetical protein
VSAGADAVDTQRQAPLIQINLQNLMTLTLIEPIFQIGVKKKEPAVKAGSRVVDRKTNVTSTDAPPPA